MATSHLKTYVHGVEPLLTDIPQQTSLNSGHPRYTDNSESPSRFPTDIGNPLNSGHPATLA